MSTSAIEKPVYVFAAELVMCFLCLVFRYSLRRVVLGLQLWSAYTKYLSLSFLARSHFLLGYLEALNFCPRCAQTLVPRYRMKS